MTPRRVEEPPAVPLPAVPLPAFRQPPGTTDPELPAVASPTPASPPEQEPTTGLPGPAAAPEAGPPPPMPDPLPRSRTTWVGRGHGSGDPNQAARMLSGLLFVALSSAAVALARRGRYLRMPSKTEMSDIMTPLGRILVRFLPLDVVGPTLVDATEAAAATHAYVLDGPLVTVQPTPEPEVGTP